jgi:hypothetical protein
MERKEELHIEFLYRALAETRNIIEFTDNKAGIIVILVGGFLAFIGTIHSHINTLILKILVTVGVANSIIAAVCAVRALNPRANPEQFIDMREFAVPPLYYLRGAPSASHWRNLFFLRPCNWLELSAIEYLRHLETLDSEALRRILIHELLKLSFIREEKLVKVTWAIRFMLAAGGFLVMMVVSLYLFSSSA